MYVESKEHEKVIENTAKYEITDVNSLSTLNVNHRFTENGLLITGELEGKNIEKYNELWIYAIVKNTNGQFVDRCTSKIQKNDPHPKFFKITCRDMVSEVQVGKIELIIQNNKLKSKKKKKRKAN